MADQEKLTSTPETTDFHRAAGRAADDTRYDPTPDEQK